MCDEIKIGTLTTRNEKTEPIEILPGKHTLTVRGPNGSDWGHSIWLFS
jgi:hypothetical protein